MIFPAGEGAVCSRALAVLMVFCALVFAYTPCRAQGLDEEGARLLAELKAAIRQMEAGSDELFMKALDVSSAAKDAGKNLAAPEPEFFTHAALAVEEVGRELFRKSYACAISRLLKTWQKGDSVYALYRLDFGDAGMCFAEFELAAGLDGRLRIVGLLNYSTGMTLEEEGRLHGVLRLADPQSVGALYGLNGGQARHVKEVQALIAAIVEGNFEAGAALYLAFPADLKARKDVSFLGLYAGSNSGSTKTYLKVLESMSAHLPGDKSLTYLMGDFYFMADRYGEALEAVKGFERQLSIEDAALLSMKAQALARLGQGEAALQTAQKAASLEPKLEMAQWALLMGYCSIGRYSKAVEVAKRLEDEFFYRMDAESLSRTETYEDFLGSPEYLKWRESLDEE